MKVWISVASLAFVCFFQKGDAVGSWTTPVVATANGAHTETVAENQALNTAINTYVAAGGTATYSYSLPTAVSPFAVSTGGALTITAALDFESTTSYTLEIEAVDSATPPATGTLTVTVTVTDVNEAPAFAASVLGFCHASGTAAGTTVTTLTATDQDAGDTVTLSLTAGNGAGDFTFTAASGLLVVASGKTLQTSTTAGYALTFEAVDNDGTPLTGTTTLIILVPSACGASAALIASLGLVLLMSFITLLK